MGKGQLLFKGDKPKKKKKKSKHASPSSTENVPDEDPSTATYTATYTATSTAGIPSTTSQAPQAPAANPSIPVAATAAPASSAAPAPAPAAPSVKDGTGTITTSGTVVTGYDTKFEKELHAGDAILVALPDGQEELRVITMRLSNVSLNLSSAFSNNVKHPTSFQYIRKPRDVAKERREAQKRHAETQHEQTTHAFDLYGNEALVYREKTETGSYRIKREQLDATTGRSSRSRGDLLHMRAKKSSDKYC